jgi:hypothetical protein
MMPPLTCLPRLCRCRARTVPTQPSMTQWLRCGALDHPQSPRFDTQVKIAHNSSSCTPELTAPLYAHPGVRGAGGGAGDRPCAAGGAARPPQSRPPVLPAVRHRHLGAFPCLEAVRACRGRSWQTAACCPCLAQCCLGGIQPCGTAQVIPCSSPLVVLQSSQAHSCACHTAAGAGPGAGVPSDVGHPLLGAAAPHLRGVRGPPGTAAKQRVAEPRTCSNSGSPQRKRFL